MGTEEVSMAYPQSAVERAMKVQEVILRAIDGKLTWVQAADILGYSPRTVRRIRWRLQHFGYEVWLRVSSRFSLVVVMVKRFVEHPGVARSRDERRPAGEPFRGMPRYGSPPNFRSWGKCGPRFSRAASCGASGRPRRRDAELAEALGRRATAERQVEAPVVVLVLPAGELLGQLLGTLELCPPIELVGIASMTALDLPVALRATSGDPAVQNTDILEMPREVGAELRPVVGLNPLDRHRQAPPYLVDERDRRLDRVVVVDLQDPETRRLIDGRELIEPTRAELQVLDVDLHRLAWDPDVTPAPRARAIPLEGDPRHVVLLEDTVNRWGRHVHLMIAGQEH